MKSILYSVLFLLTATNSIAQTSVSDTTIHIRGGADYYYIDGCKILGSSSLTGTIVKDATVITGGLPVNYGDINSSIIQVNATPVPTIPRKAIVSDKEQKLATE
ncbi:hypothetical protein [Fluviicola taffensis]|uniref:hypothetical protein n=1 Tax=Fluviicola taffensis TaxID=191579 RepID=UPI003138151C